jgi:hypothetical protein
MQDDAFLLRATDLSGKTTKLNVRPSTSIYHTKARLAHAIGTPIRSIIMYFDGQMGPILHDHMRLEESGICNETHDDIFFVVHHTFPRKPLCRTSSNQFPAPCAVCYADMPARSQFTVQVFRSFMDLPAVAKRSPCKGVVDHARLHAVTSRRSVTVRPTDTANVCHGCALRTAATLGKRHGCALRTAAMLGKRKRE